MRIILYAVAILFILLASLLVKAQGSELNLTLPEETSNDIRYFNFDISSQRDGSFNDHRTYTAEGTSPRAKAYTSGKGSMDLRIWVQPPPKQYQSEIKPLVEVAGVSFGQELVK